MKEPTKEDIERQDNWIKNNLDLIEDMEPEFYDKFTESHKVVTTNKNK